MTMAELAELFARAAVLSAQGTSSGTYVSTYLLCCLRDAAQEIAAETKAPPAPDDH